MVYGVLKLINFAHDAVFAVGAVGVFYIFGSWFGINEPMTGPALLFMILGSLLVGGIVSAIGAALLERTAYRPLRKRGAARLSFLISAIGASFFMTYMLQQGFLLGPGKRGFPNFMETQSTFRLLGSTVTNTKLLTVLAAVVCLIILDWVINKTRTGRSIRALSEDIVASQ